MADSFTPNYKQNHQSYFLLQLQNVNWQADPFLFYLQILKYVLYVQFLQILTG